MNAIQGQANKNKAKKVYSQDPSLCEQLYSFTLTTSTQFSSTLPVPQKKQTLSLFRGKVTAASRGDPSASNEAFFSVYICSKTAIKPARRTVTGTAAVRHREDIGSVSNEAFVKSLDLPLLPVQTRAVYGSVVE